MTTIVFDGARLACDSRRTIGDRVEPFEATPKFEFVGGRLMASAGNDCWNEEFKVWHADKKTPYPIRASDHDDANSVTVVYERGMWLKYSTFSQFPERQRSAWVLGTGTPYALAALLCGKSAPEAVSVAMQLDTNSGGRIFVADLSDLLAIGEKAITEYRHGVSIDRKSTRAPAALQPRKNRRDIGAVRERGNEHKGRRDISRH